MYSYEVILGENSFRNVKVVKYADMSGSGEVIEEVILSSLFNCYEPRVSDLPSIHKNLQNDFSEDLVLI